MADRAQDGADAPSPTGVVVVHDDRPGGDRRHYQRIVRWHLAERIAGLLGRRFAGTYDRSATYPPPVYFIPGDTLSSAQAQELGIADRSALFGGVVPHPFVGTKAISQPLIDPEADAPPGWSHDFGRRVHDDVLRGYTVFTLDDARRAGGRLLATGTFRIKPVGARGGTGQAVVDSMEALDLALDAMDGETLSRDGLVLEENLSDVITHSIGSVCVGEMAASYYGTQRLTENNRGECVYGGSDLTIIRGGFEALDRLDLPDAVKLALREARVYHEAAHACYPGLIVSRANYDVAQGRDAEGRWRSGVLEQSWRVGGASPAEIVALEILQARPEREQVRVSCIETYGRKPAQPAGAQVFYSDTDARVGPITIHVVVED